MKVDQGLVEAAAFRRVLRCSHPGIPAVGQNTMNQARTFYPPSQTNHLPTAAVE